MTTLKDYYTGPDSIIIVKNKKKISKVKNSILILTGASDLHNNIDKIVGIFEKKIKKKFKITVIQGPYAKDIKITKNSLHEWKIIKKKLNIDKFLLTSETVITSYGLSYFDALNFNCKVIVFTNNYKREKSNIDYIRLNKYSIFIENINRIPKLILNLRTKKLKQNFFKKNHSKNILTKFDNIIKNYAF